MNLKELQKLHPNANKDTWHIHPNGGGWVENTAIVEDTVFVSEDSTISGHTEVLGNVSLNKCSDIMGNARVSGNIFIINYCTIGGTSEVTGDCLISGKAHLFGACKLHNNNVKGGEWSSVVTHSNTSKQEYSYAEELPVPKDIVCHFTPTDQMIDTHAKNEMNPNTLHFPRMKKQNQAGVSTE